MTRDDLLRMAREAGFSVRRDLETPKSYDCIAGYGDALERFAELVAAAEREACAKAIENSIGQIPDTSDWANGYIQAAKDTSSMATSMIVAMDGARVRDTDAP